jgi:pilus assembly protein Flp/PilA
LPAQKEQQKHVAAAIVGAGEGGRLERLDVDFDAQLLLELSSQSLLRALRLLDLASGKLPQAGHRPPGGALLEKDPALAVDQRRGDHQECRNFLQVGGQWKDSVNPTHLSKADWAMPDVGKRPMRLFFAKLVRDIKAASAVEYALICALIVLAMIAGLNAVAGSTITMWNNVSSDVVKHAGQAN